MGPSRGHAIFDALNALAESPDVVRTRLVNGRDTLFIAACGLRWSGSQISFSTKNLTAIREEHTPSGAHRVHEQAFPDWVPRDVLLRAKGLSVDDAFAVLPACLRPSRAR